MVTFADRALLVGLVLLLVGIASAVLLVLDVVLGRGAAVAACSLVSAAGPSSCGSRCLAGGAPRSDAEPVLLGSATVTTPGSPSCP